MPVQTLRPDSTANGDTWTVTGGPSTVHAATADDSDATYASAPDGSTHAWVGLGNLVGVPAGSRITSVAVRVKWSGDAAAMGAVAVVDNLTGQATPLVAFYVVPAAAYTHTFAALTTRPDGTPWTADAVNGITIQIAGNTPAVHFIELYADVTYVRRPTVTGVTPTGTVTTQQPAIGWAYAHPDGIPQERWQVRVPTLAQASAPGFNPESSPAVADSGTAYISAAAALSWTPPQALSPGVYKPHVRVADLGSGGRWSDWASATFTIVGDPPAPPAMISVVPNPAAGRVEITARQTDSFVNLMTASADGVAGEYLRWYNYGNSTQPLAAPGGLEGNAVTASVVADGEWAVFGVQKMPVVPGVEHIWAGWVKSGTVAGVVHLDTAWFAPSGTFLALDEGSPVLLTAAHQPSEGRAVPPDGAHGCYLMWRSTGPLAAGQTLAWDECGIWTSREDLFLTDLESRLIAAEDAVVDLEIRVAALERVMPVVSIQPGSAPLDVTAYRGGLDSRNLLGPVDASFVWSLAGTTWSAVGTGHLESQPDAHAYEGYSLQYVPDTVGGSHLLKLASRPIPDVTADYQFSFRHRAIGQGGLTADPRLVWDDGDGTPVGTPVTIGLQALVEGAEFSLPVGVNATPPAGAARFHLELTLDGDVDDASRWVFDQFQVIRLPVPPPDATDGFGYGPFGYGPFGGTPSEGGPALVAWKPASQCDVYPLAEYSTDDGATWTPVRLTERAAYDPITRIARIHHYEAPLGVPVLYRVRTAARDYQVDPVSGALIVSAPTTTREATLTVDGYHVVDPFTQQRARFEHSASGGAPELSMNVERPQGVFSPVGRDYKFITQDVTKGGEFAWRIVLPDAAAWDAFEAMLKTGHTLLVQTPIGRSWHILAGSYGITAVLEGSRDHGAVVEFTGYEQARPGGG